MVRVLLALTMLALTGCVNVSRAYATGCALGDGIGFDNGNFDANLCLPMEQWHVPFFLPLPANRHERAVLAGFEDCYYDGYVDGFLDAERMVDCS